MLKQDFVSHILLQVPMRPNCRQNYDPERCEELLRPLGHPQHRPELARAVAEVAHELDEGAGELAVAPDVHGPDDDQEEVLYLLLLRELVPHQLVQRPRLQNLQDAVHVLRLEGPSLGVYVGPVEVVDEALVQLLLLEVFLELGLCLEQFLEQNKGVGVEVQRRHQRLKPLPRVEVVKQVFFRVFQQGFLQFKPLFRGQVVVAPLFFFG